MNALTTALLSACLTTAAASAVAHDMKSGEDTKPTKQECKAHMEMAKKGIARNTASEMKQDAMCADVMKKDEMIEAGLVASAPKTKK